ncbi:phage tail protein [Photorhabdus luminescens]|uniref:phage tail protein n=1 Tax=Photorhabdus luminescens TaxID=29488 RepID=UPI00210B5854|nr:phage tail protein [Photorhabdus luminescens]
MKNPNLIPRPFAQNGQKDEIPADYKSDLPSQKATWNTGFPQVTMMPVTAGGLPPSGKDFNGIFNQISDNIVHLSKGGKYKFSLEYANSIGGYPKGAILQSDDETKEFQSLVDNNKINFNTESADKINSAWKLVSTSDLLDELNKKLNKFDVVQSVGSGTSQVMSQKSVTDALNTKQDKGDYATNSALKTVNDNANSRLAKSQNGADIPDKNAFVKNLGLSETVNKANNAVPSSRKINGKALSGDIGLSAGDVGAISVNPLSTLTESKKFQDFLSSGFVLVNVPNTATVSDFPFPTRVYGFGILEVRSSGVVIYQKYASHHGEIALRQSWNSGKTWIGWDIVYSSAILPPEQHPVGAPIPYPHRYTPAGYLTCNGQTFNKSLYPKLAEAYPDGRVPDLRGEFIRGWDDSRGVDPGRVCGSWQADSTKRIQLATGNADSRYMVPNQGPQNGYIYPLGRDVKGGATDTSIANNTGGNETRPRNIAFNYIVRAA